MIFRISAVVGAAALIFISSAFANQSGDEIASAGSVAVAELRGADIPMSGNYATAAVTAAAEEASKPAKSIRIVGPVFFPDH